MTSQTIQLNRLARSASLILLNNSVYHKHETIKNIVFKRMKKTGALHANLVKFAKNNNSSPAAMSVELSTDIMNTLLQELPEYQKFNYITNFHTIFQALCDRLFNNLVREHPKSSKKKG